MAQEGGGQLLRRDAAAVVRDADVGQAALFQLGGNGGGAGVKSVFQKLLAHGGGAFHHLAGGDQVRQMGRQLLDLGHGMGPPFKSPAGRKGQKNDAFYFRFTPVFSGFTLHDEESMILRPQRGKTGGQLRRRFSSYRRFRASSGLRESTCVRRMVSAASLSAMADSDS